MMQLTQKLTPKIQASCTLEGTVLENVESIKYLGVTITNDLKWNTHIINICTKAKRTLGFLRRNLYSCSQDVKEAAYKGMVRPILELVGLGPLYIRPSFLTISYHPRDHCKAVIPLL